ncbi:MAG: ABC transporter ATP-binding protein [Anaerolineales bacterium]
MSQTDRIKTAAELIRAGDKAAAKDLLAGLLRDEPQLADAWYLVSFVTEVPARRMDALERALSIDPSHPYANTRIELLRGDGSAADMQPERKAGAAAGAPAQGSQSPVGTDTEAQTPAIEVNGLRRVYKVRTGVIRRSVKEVVAVDGISFDVRPGELFGLLGPNGAGKTTTVKMLTTLLTPTDGSARVAGFDVVDQAQAIRKRIGFIFGGERGLYWRLSGFDNLRYFATLYHVEPAVAKKRIPALLELVGLGDRADEKVEGYSRGMKQRLHVARTLLHDPEILFLDEPTMGLDPVGGRQLRAVIRDLQSQHKTILLTTHYMFEADALCDRIGVIDHGKIVALDTPEGLKKHVRDLSVVEIEVFGIPEEILATLRAKPFVDTVAVEDREQKQSLRVHTPMGAEAVPELMATLAGVRVGRVQVREPTLEDAYVRLVSEGDGG